MRRLIIVLLALVIALPGGLLLTLYAKQREMLFVGAYRDLGGASAAEAVIPGAEVFSLATADGEKLTAFYVPPEEGKVVFLFLDGNAGKLREQARRWQEIGRLGAGVLAFYYRGYGTSSGSPSEDGLMLDANAAHDWLRQRVSADRIVIHGYSLGTGVATKLAADREALAVVLEAPFTAAVDRAAELYPVLPIAWFMSDQFVSRSAIARVDMPVLIAHGDQDTVIPVAHGRRLFELAREPKQLEIFAGGDHDSLVRDGIYVRIERFLERLRRVEAGGANPQEG